MSNLSKRVEKAKKLRIIPASQKGCYNVYGSKDDLYKVCLKSDTKNLVTPDGYRPTKVFRTNCQKVTNSGGLYKEQCQYCEGNNHHTVCYHCLGAIWFSLKYAGLQVSFFETYDNATNGLNFGGTLAKIENQNGTGAVWCIYQKIGKRQGKEDQQYSMLLPEQKILSSKENIQLMRGSEDDEGID